MPMTNHISNKFIKEGVALAGEGAGGPRCASAPAAAEPRRVAGAPRKSVSPNDLQRERAHPHDCVPPCTWNPVLLRVTVQPKKIWNSAAAFAAAASSWVPF